MEYQEFATRLVQSRILSDPWLDGKERFRLRGVVLTHERARALLNAAEAMGALLEEVAELVWRTPTLLDTFYHLTPHQKLMWFSSGGLWHGIARADLFELEDGGIACCEVNSDTPSGEAEAVLLHELLAPEHGAVLDPNTGFRDHFLAMLRASHGPRPIRRVGIVYPTELTEDLSMIALYREWLQAEGIPVVLGSPWNLAEKDGRIELLGEPVDMIIRHYKTDWWGEREPVFFDQQPYQDSDALHEPLRCLLRAAERKAVTVVNPFGAVIPQNKLSYALCHEKKAWFTPSAQATIERYLPETRRLSVMEREELLTRREEWVLKSDYGCEGAETVVGAFVSEREWKDTLEMAVPSRWVAQRYFRARRDEERMFTNYGVFLLGGRGAGFFTRVSPEATSYGALTVPTFVQWSDKGTTDA